MKEAKLMATKKKKPNNRRTQTRRTTTRVTRQPVAAFAITAQPTGANMQLGGRANFSVMATGQNVKYQWYKDGTPILNATNRFFTIANVNAGHAGSYTVKITDDNNRTPIESNPAVLTVTPATNPAPTTAPIITTQPTNLTKNVGDTAVLTVVATGTGPLTYEWSKDGTPIPNSNNASLILAHLVAGNAGKYKVKVSNAAGSVTSNEVTLTVNAVQPVRQPWTKNQKWAAVIVLLIIGAIAYFGFFNKGGVAAPEEGDGDGGGQETAGCVISSKDASEYGIKANELVKEGGTRTLEGSGHLLYKATCKVGDTDGLAEVSSEPVGCATGWDYNKQDGPDCTPETSGEPTEEPDAGDEGDTGDEGSGGDAGDTGGTTSSCTGNLSLNQDAMAFPSIVNTMDSGAADFINLVYAKDATGAKFVAIIDEGLKLTFESIEISGKQIQTSAPMDEVVCAGNELAEENGAYKLWVSNKSAPDGWNTAFPENDGWMMKITQYSTDSARLENPYPLNWTDASYKLETNHELNSENGWLNFQGWNGNKSGSNPGDGPRPFHVIMEPSCKLTMSDKLQGTSWTVTSSDTVKVEGSKIIPFFMQMNNDQAAVYASTPVNVYVGSETLPNSLPAGWTSSCSN
jgi:hypothetical protein